MLWRKPSSLSNIWRRPKGGGGHWHHGVHRRELFGRFGEEWEPAKLCKRLRPKLMQNLLWVPTKTGSATLGSDAFDRSSEQGHTSVTTYMVCFCAPQLRLKGEYFKKAAKSLEFKDKGRCAGLFQSCFVWTV